MSSSKPAPQRLRAKLRRAALRAPATPADAPSEAPAAPQDTIEPAVKPGQAKAAVYGRPPAAVAVLQQRLGLSRKKAERVLRALLAGGYYVAPRVPTDSMLVEYFRAYGNQPWSPASMVNNLPKARLRWQAMGKAGSAVAFSQKGW